MFGETHHLRAHIFGILAVLAAASLWGTAGTVQSFLSDGSAPAAVGALRVVLAALFLIGVAWATGAMRLGTQPLPYQRITSAGVAIGLYNVVFFPAISLTGVAIGTAITIGSAPIWASLIEILLGKPDLTIAKVIGQACAIIGVALLCLDAVSLDLSVTGVLLSALAGLCYAVYSLVTSGMPRGLPSTLAAALTFSVGAVVVAPFLVWFPPTWLATGSNALLIMYLGFAATGIAYVSYTWGLRHVRPSTAVTLALTEPVVAWLLAVFLLGEVLTSQGTLGALAVLSGLILVAFAATRPRPATSSLATQETRK